MQPYERGEELPDVATAARWSCGVHQASNGSLLSIERSRVYSSMVNTPFLTMASTEDNSNRGRASEAQVARRAPQVLRLRQSGLIREPARSFPQNLPGLEPVAIGIAKAQFFRRVTETLSNIKAVVKLNLFRIPCVVCNVHPNRALLVERYGIHEMVAVLWREDGTVLARDRVDSRAGAQVLPRGSRYAQELNRAEETHNTPYSQQHVWDRHGTR
ncbi:hypothetical protein H4582DRAFT_403792 [Lactarius indigo]|nr:hypothetical protein H4582DRAFT_403792 [Lactarius indigo]